MCRCVDVCLTARTDHNRLLPVLGEMQRAAQQSGDLREDGGGAGAGSHQADELHVLSGTVSHHALLCPL